MANRLPFGRSQPRRLANISAAWLDMRLTFFMSIRTRRFGVSRCSCSSCLMRASSASSTRYTSFTRTTVIAPSREMRSRPLISPRCAFRPSRIAAAADAAASYCSEWNSSESGSFEFLTSFDVLVQAAEGPLFEIALREGLFPILDHELERPDFENVA